MQKTIAILEISLVIGLLFFLRSLLRGLGFSDWQQPIFGSAPLSSSLVFFVLPFFFVLVVGRNPGSFGLSTERLGYHLRVALRALAVLLPVTMLFPLLVVLNTDPKQWLGSTILAFGFAAGGLIIVSHSRDLANESETPIGIGGFFGYLLLLVTGLVLVALLHPVAPLLARMVLALLFVGFLEEVFFRGYIQSRLNQAFGKPYSFHGVEFGVGLLLAAAIFGLMHPLFATEQVTPWAWALWTAVGGVVFGFLREKTGSVVTPGLVHGVILVPGVLFGSV